MFDPQHSSARTGDPPPLRNWCDRRKPSCAKKPGDPETGFGCSSAGQRVRICDCEQNMGHPDASMQEMNRRRRRPLGYEKKEIPIDRNPREWDPH